MIENVLSSTNSTKFGVENSFLVVLTQALRIIARSYFCAMEYWPRVSEI